MLNELLFDEENNFQVVSTEKRDGKVLVNVESRQNGCNCPCVMQKASESIATISGLSLICLCWVMKRGSD